MRMSCVFLGIFGNYLLSYACVLAIAARKGHALGSIYSLTVWLFSAAIIFGACAVLPGILFAVLRFRRVWLGRMLVLWGALILFLSLALFVSAA